MSDTWRVGRKLGRTLYLNDEVVGMVDTSELAARIVDAMNVPSTHPKNVSKKDESDDMTFDESVKLIRVEFSNDPNCVEIARKAVEEAAQVWKERGAQVENVWSAERKQMLERIQELEARDANRCEVINENFRVSRLLAAERAAHERVEQFALDLERQLSEEKAARDRAEACLFRFEEWFGSSQTLSRTYVEYLIFRAPGGVSQAQYASGLLTRKDLEAELTQERERREYWESEHSKRRGETLAALMVEKAAQDRAESAEAELKKAHGEAAAIRKASQDFIALIGDAMHGVDVTKLDPERKLARAYNDALSSNAGREFLERLEKAEARIKELKR